MYSLYTCVVSNLTVSCMSISMEYRDCKREVIKYVISLICLYFNMAYTNVYNTAWLTFKCFSNTHAMSYIICNV